MRLNLVTDPHQDLSHEILCKRLADVYQSLEIDTQIFQTMYLEELLHYLESNKPDLVFTNQSWFKTRAGEQINSHAVFEKCNIAYIGSQPNTLDLLLHKAKLKNLWRSKGISTPDFQIVYRKNFKAIPTFVSDLNLQDYPYIIKPNNAGNSSGIDQNCIADDFCQLSRIITEKFDMFPELLIEKFLGDDCDLQEFTVAQIGSDTRAVYLPVEIRLITKETRRLITTRDKDLHGTETVPVAGDFRKRLIAFSKKAFKVAGVQDYGRLDVLSTRDGLFALEINGQPMIPDRWFEGCAQGANMDEDQYLAAILFASVMRWKKSNKTSVSIPDKLVKRIPDQIIAKLS